MTYPTFTDADLAPTGVAFKAIIGEETTPAFTSPAALLAYLGEHGSLACPVYMSEGDGVTVDKITREELRRLDRAGKRERNRAANLLESAHRGPNGDKLRESVDHVSTRLSADFGTLVDAIGDGRAEGITEGAVGILYNAQRLDYRLGRSEKRREILESAVEGAAKQGAISRDEWQNLNGSPVAAGQELRAALDALETAAPGNLASRVRVVIESAVYLHAAALERMNLEREATERAHKLAGEVAEYRTQRDDEGRRAVSAESAALATVTCLKRIIAELDGWTVGMLPRNAYGTALLDAVNDARRELAL